MFASNGNELMILMVLMIVIRVSAKTAHTCFFPCLILRSRFYPEEEHMEIIFNNCSKLDVYWIIIHFTHRQFCLSNWTYNYWTYYLKLGKLSLILAANVSVNLINFKLIILFIYTLFKIHGDDENNQRQVCTDSNNGFFKIKTFFFRLFFLFLSDVFL